MPKKGSRSFKNSTEFDEDWKKHDIYDLNTSENRVLTRSQTAFIRVKNTESDLELFAEAKRHNPPGLPHLMTTLKGRYGAVPRTIVTKDVGEHLPVSKGLCEKVNFYKTARQHIEDEEGMEMKKKNPRRRTRRGR